MVENNAPPSEGIRSRRHKPSPPSPTTPPTLSTPPILSPTSLLWLRSRQNPSHSLRPAGEDRPLTLSNIRLAISLIPLLWARFAMLFWRGERMRMAIFILGKLVKGVLPALKIYWASQLLDQVQQSFSNPSELNRPLILRTALFSLLASTSTTISTFLLTTNDTHIRTHLTHTIEHLYLSTQLSLDIPTLSDPFIAALMFEAGCFAGFEQRQARPGARGMKGRGGKGPFATVAGLLAVLTSLVEVGSQGGMLYRTLREGVDLGTKSGGFPRTLGEVNPSIVLIILSFLPSIFSILSTLSTLRPPRPTRPTSTSPTSTSASSSRTGSWLTTRRAEQSLKLLIRSGTYKQELVLFGLSDWVMKKWEGVRREQMIQDEGRRGNGWREVGWGVGEEGVQVGFYTLLALQSFSTPLTLGSIRLYQSTADSLLHSLKSLLRHLEESTQVVFYAAAFLEGVELRGVMEGRGRRGLLGVTEGVLNGVGGKSKGVGVAVGDGAAEVVDYEETRREGGMKIEARGLNFTYPGMEKPVLRNINLLIAPGTTLAIVGFNGGGKTTLVKVLMGLYDHSGTLLINDVPASSFSPAALHARTTACFQDHSKYSLTLRENVGIGCVELMQDDEAVEEAIRRGGAEGILRKVGLEGRLERLGVPDAAGEGGGGGEGGEGEEEEDDFGPPPGPPPPGRGGRGGGHGGRGGRGGGGFLGSSGRKFEPPPGAPSMGEMKMMMDEMGRKPAKEEERNPLSGGQWQRLALARAFIRAERADLVVFDEPSSALDPRAEAELFNSIHSLSGTAKGKKTTTIYISHRFSTVRRADKIAVVEDGTISECGSHEELMEKKGRYFELFNLQKEGFK